MSDVTENNKELWIDLECLGLSSHQEDGYVVFYEEFNDEHPEPFPNLTWYSLRIALRALGYKVTKRVSVLRDLQAIFVSYHTNISQEIHQKATQVYNSHVDEICEERYVE
jgi:hypothetical protein